MKSNLYFALSLVFVLSAVIVSTSYLSNLFNVGIEWIEPILFLLTSLLILDYFDRKESRKSIWEIVSYSKKDKAVFVLHLLVYTIIVGWIAQRDLAYKGIYCLLFFAITCFSFLICSSPEVRKECIQKYSKRTRY
jgi:hypothetical protein